MFIAAISFFCKRILGFVQGARDGNAKPDARQVISTSLLRCISFLYQGRAAPSREVRQLVVNTLLLLPFISLARWCPSGISTAG